MKKKKFFMKNKDTFSKDYQKKRTNNYKDMITIKKTSKKYRTISNKGFHLLNLVLIISIVTEQILQRTRYTMNLIAGRILPLDRTRRTKVGDKRRFYNLMRPRPDRGLLYHLQILFLSFIFFRT